CKRCWIRSPRTWKPAWIWGVWRPSSGATNQYFDQPKAPDIPTCLPNLTPVLVNAVQPIVTITSLRRVRRPLACAPNDPHGQPIELVTGQGQIPARQRLVGDLAPGLRVSAAMARGKNFVPKVCRVLIAAG